jgi:hypothetical protein
MVALLLIAHAIALNLGETLRNQLFPEGSRKQQIYSFLSSTLSSNLIPRHPLLC